MIEYNLLYDYLNKYGSFVNGIAQGSQEWRDVTTEFTRDLYQQLYVEEHCSLGRIHTTSSDKMTIINK